MQTPVERIKATPALDKAYYIRIAKMLILPFNRQEAYHHGLIDSDGNEKKEATTETEKQSYTELHQLVYGLKKYILQKPGGSALLKRTSVALNTLGKMKNKKIEGKDIPTIMEQHIKNESFVLENELSLSFEEALLEHVVSLLEDSEAPTNTTAGVDKVELPMGSIVKRKKVSVVDGEHGKTE